MKVSIICRAVAVLAAAAALLTLALPALAQPAQRQERREARQDDRRGRRDQRSTPPLGYTAVSAANLTDSSGVPIANATIAFAPVDNSGKPISYQINGSGQSHSQPVTTLVTTGAMNIQLADTALTSPVNVCFSVTITDNISGKSLLGPGYTCFQPAGSGLMVTTGVCTAATGSAGGSCNFDKFVPNLPGQALIQTGPIGPMGPTGPTGPTGPMGPSGPPYTGCASNGANGMTCSGTLSAGNAVQSITPHLDITHPTYGATTGASNNTAAFNAAWTAAGTGGNIFVPAGSFTMTGQLTGGISSSTNNIWVTGTGFGSTLTLNYPSGPQISPQGSGATSAFYLNGLTLQNQTTQPLISYLSRVYLMNTWVTGPVSCYNAGNCPTVLSVPNIPTGYQSLLLGNEFTRAGALVQAGPAANGIWGAFNHVDTGNGPYIYSSLGTSSQANSGGGIIGGVYEMTKYGATALLTNTHGYSLIGPGEYDPPATTISTVALTTTSASTAATVAACTNVSPGAFIVSTNVPVSTYVVGACSGGTVTLSQNAIATGTDSAATFGMAYGAVLDSSSYSNWLQFSNHYTVPEILEGTPNSNYFWPHVHQYTQQENANFPFMAVCQAIGGSQPCGVGLNIGGPLNMQISAQGNYQAQYGMLIRQWITDATATRNFTGVYLDSTKSTNGSDASYAIMGNRVASGTLSIGTSAAVTGSSSLGNLQKVQTSDPTVPLLSMANFSPAGITLPGSAQAFTGPTAVISTLTLGGKSVTGVAGTGATVATTTGAVTASHLPLYLSNGTLQDAGIHANFVAVYCGPATFAGSTTTATVDCTTHIPSMSTSTHCLATWYGTNVSGGALATTVTGSPNTTTVTVTSAVAPPASTVATVYCDTF